MFVFAVGEYGEPVLPISGSAPLSSATGIISFFKALLRAVAILFWIAAVIYIFYAGYLYLTAAGDPKGVEKANSQLKYAVIAVAVGLMAYGAPTFVETILKGQFTG
jgi:hypothetical protein